MIEDEDTELAKGDIILHVPDSELNGLTDEDSDESDDEAQGNINHLGKGMLNTLSFKFDCGNKGKIEIIRSCLIICNVYFNKRKGHL